MPLSNISPTSLTAQDGLLRLKEGNQRFLHGEARFSVTHNKETLADLAKGQHPFATILGCSDSRVPPELIFDAGFGDLFIVRVAGNVISAEVMGSMQFAGLHLKTPLFVVLGHEGCGAVQAAVAYKLRGQRPNARIQDLVDGILPSVPDYDGQISPEEYLAAAVESNVRWTMQQIMQTSDDQDRLVEGPLHVIGAVYEIATGKVRFLDDDIITT